MAVNLTGLTTYVEQNANGLIAKASLGAPSLKYFTIQTGVKGQTTINVLNTTVSLGNGKACGWNEAGASTVSQRTITPWSAKINMSFCDKAMQDYFMNAEVNIAAGRQNLPFEEQFIADVIKGANEQVENAVWQGVTIGSTKYDGLLDILASNGVNKVTNGATKFDTVKAVYKAIPAAVLTDTVIFMGVDDYRDLVMELVEKNLYHHPANDNADVFEMILPGTATKIVGVPGLNGTNKMAALPLSETVYGVDMQNDQEVFKFWYSDDNQEFRLAINFNGGVQIAFLDNAVLAEAATTTEPDTPAGDETPSEDPSEDPSEPEE